ncbi:MAG: PepSY domain-containing protein [Tannerella sp.]|jgi:uncharacterized iron-regulated membrane protein|nr:PepSY domain-containing protein [Tannerella sp.]
MSRDFFRIVLVGHYCLWLPLNIGKPVVACGTLVFAFVMLMGLVLWLYRARKRLAVNWTAKWRRKIYDLHNVFGFYAALIIFTLAVTGLIMGFQWFADAVYWISSGGKSMPVQTVPVSDTVNISQPLLPIDHLMQRYLTNEPSGKSIILYLPQTAGAPFRLCVNNRAGTYYKTDYHFFDRFTLEELTAEGIYSGKYDDMSVANKIMRMNYDIHVGAIGGLPGKILAFFGSLIAASLPVTGFITTLSKRKRKKL